MKIKKNEIKETVKNLKYFDFSNAVKDCYIFLPFDTDDLDVNTSTGSLVEYVERSQSGYANLTKPGLLLNYYGAGNHAYAYVTLEYPFKLSFKQFFGLNQILNRVSYNDEESAAINFLLDKDAYLIKAPTVLAVFGEI